MAEFSVELVVGEGEELEEAMQRLADDRDAWYATNPAMGVRIDPDWIEANERTTMTVEEFLIERLSVVFEGVSSKLVVPNWARLADGPDDETGYLGSKIATDRAWAVAVSPVEHGPQWASLGVAGNTAGGRVQVELARAQTVELRCEAGHSQLSTGTGLNAGGTGGPKVSVVGRSMQRASTAAGVARSTAAGGAR